MPDVVVVESPAKAKTINKYLGSGFKVLASYGHVRDLPSKDGSVRPDADFEMDWEVDGRSEKHIKAIADAVKSADTLFLATDPDREGEAISWHVQEVLQKKKLLANVDVKRVVFNEITKSAVQAAFDNPRDLDQELIDAYLARRALDYLVGFTLSPVLWRKLPGSRSAGRVQSVALRLICEREAEIEIFKKQEFWTVTATFAADGGHKMTAQLTHLDGKKLGKMALADAEAAAKAQAVIEAGTFTVAEVQRKKTRRHPSPPFTTSTLQQEAARKLYMSAKRTMQVAQRLYEGANMGGETVGLITYMRTDGVQMAGEAVAACRSVIQDSYGAPYLPDVPRAYKSKAKNAQEAHEAIRPTDLRRRPEDVARYLDSDQLKLYELIWKRTVASQMESAVLDQVAVDIAAHDGSAQLRATGSVIAFDGFLKVYQEGKDEQDGQNGDKDEDRLRILPDVQQGQALARQGVETDQHFTQPPPRYTEASLVKRLEELGIGRPSTYASILSVLQERNYVKLESRRFEPEDRGRLVTAFLTSFFTRYVEYDFTADLEESLDDISGGRRQWKQVLRDFWAAFSGAVAETKDLRVREVLDALDDLLGPHFFPKTETTPNPRKCPSCDDGRLSLKLGKFGAFIGCSNYPDCRHTQALEVPNGDAGESEGTVMTFPKVLGTDPATDKEVSLRKGPYGAYVQLGEADDDTPKPKRASLPKGLSPAAVDLETALGLLALPRDVGPHPETGDMITAGIGRFGPFIKMGGTYVSLKGDDDVLTVGLNRAVALFADKPRKDPPKELGKHPKDGKPVVQKAGRWGPYVQHGRLMASLPKGTDKDSVTLDQAVDLLAAKAAKDGKAPAKKGAQKKAPAKKTAARKSTKRKAPAKKKTAAKPKAKTSDSQTAEA